MQEHAMASLHPRRAMEKLVRSLENGFGVTSGVRGVGSSDGSSPRHSAGISVGPALAPVEAEGRARLCAGAVAVESCRAAIRVP
jgi:hypothetical protein